LLLDSSLFGQKLEPRSFATASPLFRPTHSTPHFLLHRTRVGLSQSGVFPPASVADRSLRNFYHLVESLGEKPCSRAFDQTREVTQASSGHTGWYDYIRLVHCELIPPRSFSNFRAVLRVVPFLVVLASPFIADSIDVPHCDRSSTE